MWCGLQRDIVSNSIDYSKRSNGKNISYLIENDNFIEKTHRSELHSTILLVRIRTASIFSDYLGNKIIEKTLLHYAMSFHRNGMKYKQAHTFPLLLFPWL